MTSWRTTIGCSASALGLVALLGCGDRARSGPEHDPLPSASAQATAAPSASPSSSVSAHAGQDDPMVGRWTATYRAVRTEVEVPAGLPAKTWKADDGSTATGAGRIELFIEPGGQARGTAEGPLGKLTLRGVVDGEVLRVGVSPEPSNAPPVFGGLLVARLERDVFVGELRVSSGDGSVVRTSSLRMARPERFRVDPPATSAASSAPL